MRRLPFRNGVAHAVAATGEDVLAEAPIAPGASTAARLGRARAGSWAVNAAFLLLAFAAGGSVYEHLVLDTVWPRNFALIQPQHDGVDRKLFWMPLHFALTLVLPLALWGIWRLRSVRRHVLVAIAGYAALRLWSALYFIPRALEFETVAAAPPRTVEEAQTWVLLSLLRFPLVVAALVALHRARRELALFGLGASEASAADPHWTPYARPR